MFAFGDENLGITICEDVWNDKTFWANRRYERDPVTELAAQGTTVIINISAFSLHDRQAGVAGGHVAIDRNEPSAADGLRQSGGRQRQSDFRWRQRGADRGRQSGRAGAAFEEDLVLFDTATGQGEIHEQPREEIAYAFRALVMGTRDYVHKCRFQKALVGLSGGIDSAVVAAIAVEALGAENVLGVSMPGPYSSEGSEADAKAVAENLGIELKTIPISPVFDAYRTALKPVFGSRKPDVTEENIQARIRGNYLMALSNKFGSMVLSTGNKSELAVGYCTLYGDMAGGLAVISDVPKLMVYELAKFINPRTTGDGKSSRAPPSKSRHRRSCALIKRTKTVCRHTSAGPHSEGLYRGFAQPAGDCGQIRFRAETGARDCPAGGSHGVQAQAGGSGTEDYFARIRIWTAVPDRAAVYSIETRGSLEETTAPNGSAAVAAISAYNS